MNKAMMIFVFGSALLGLQARAGGSSTVGPGNPAAINCLKLGGTLERYRDGSGENSYCVIEEWNLYRAMGERGLLPPGPGGAVMLANPAAVNCTRIGGDVRIVDQEGGQAGYCVIEQWRLFRVIDVTREP